MKFFAGLIFGIILTIIFFLPAELESESSPTPSGLTMFTEKGDCISTRRKSLVVFQTIQPDRALAHYGKSPNELLVLLTNYEGTSYYDDQEIKIPSTKCARQIGTFQYTTKMDFLKTVPVVNIE